MQFWAFNRTRGARGAPEHTAPVVRVDANAWERRERPAPPLHEFLDPNNELVAPYARPEKSEAQLRELALKVELTKNKTLGPGRHRRFGGIHQWEGVQSGVLPFRRGDGALRELYAIDATPRAGALPRV